MKQLCFAPTEKIYITADGWKHIPAIFSEQLHRQQHVIHTGCVSLYSQRTSPNMKTSTPLLRIARDISPYLGSMARINLKKH